MGLGSESRINVPARLENNWHWRVKNGLLTKELCGEIYEATRRYGRLNWEAPSVQQALKDRGGR